MADVGASTYKVCISCDRFILPEQGSRPVHGFPIHVACYERELGILKQRDSGREPERFSADLSPPSGEATGKTSTAAPAVQCHVCRKGIAGLRDAVMRVGRIMHFACYQRLLKAG